MATYEQLITTPYTSTGDDVYAKPVVSGDVVSSPWDEDDVAALEIGTTNTYAITVDETKAYIVYLNVSSNAFTVNAGTDVFTKAGHGLANGETIRFLGADLPEPLEQSTIYYVRDVTTDTFKVATTANGTAVDIDDIGSGVIRYVAPSERSSSDQVVGSISKIRDSELTGEAEMTALLEAIYEKVRLIGTSAVINDDGSVASKTIMRLMRNEAYDGTANAVKSFAVTKDFTSGWTGTLTIRHRTTSESLLSKSVTVASSTSLTCSLSSTDTAFALLTSDEDFGPHPFDIQMISGSSRQTPINGIAIITKDLTIT